MATIVDAQNSNLGRKEYVDEKKQLPPALADFGVKGITAGNIDLTLCTYCAGHYPSLLNYLAMSWTGESWDDIEILAGKEQRPTPGIKKQYFLEIASTKPTKTTWIFRR